MNGRIIIADGIRAWGTTQAVESGRQKAEIGGEKQKAEGIGQKVECGQQKHKAGRF